MDEKRKYQCYKKTPSKEVHLTIQTYNGPTADVENTNGTNVGGDLLFSKKPRIVPRRKERMPQANKRKNRVTIDLSTHPQGHQIETQKITYSMD